MLAWRAVSRSFVRRHWYRDTSRPISRSRPLSVYPVSSLLRVRPTLFSRLWYRRDGTQRSKIKGLVIGTVGFATFFLMWNFVAATVDLAVAVDLLRALVQVQRVDREFSSVEYSDYNSMLLYLQELCNCYFEQADVPQDVADVFFKSVSELAGSTKDVVLIILQETCRDTHQILMDSGGKEPVDTANEVSNRLTQGLMQIVEVLQDTLNDDFTKLLKEQKVFPEPVAKNDYEVVG